VQAALSNEIPHISVMTIRTRKFFGAIALVVLAATWALVGMALAQCPGLQVPACCRPPTTSS